MRFGQVESRLLSPSGASSLVGYPGELEFGCRQRALAEERERRVELVIAETPDLARNRADVHVRILSEHLAGAQDELTRRGDPDQSPMFLHSASAIIQVVDGAGNQLVPHITPGAFTTQVASPCCMTSPSDHLSQLLFLLFFTD